MFSPISQVVHLHDGPTVRLIQIRQERSNNRRPQMSSMERFRDIRTRELDNDLLACSRSVSSESSCFELRSREVRSGVEGEGTEIEVRGGRRRGEVSEVVDSLHDQLHVGGGVESEREMHSIGSDFCEVEIRNELSSESRSKLHDLHKSTLDLSSLFLHAITSSKMQQTKDQGPPPGKKQHLPKYFQHPIKTTTSSIHRPLTSAKNLATFAFASVFNLNLGRATLKSGIGPFEVFPLSIPL